MLGGAKEAARELVSESAVTAMIDHLPLKEGARIIAFGDSHTSDPQSWAVILKDLLTARGASVAINAAPGDTTTHGLIRIGEVVAQQPDWVLLLIGVNDARTQGPKPSKTLVDHQETVRNLRELHQRISHETKARCLWITPPAVNEERVSNHCGLSRFGVRFRNEDIARVVAAIRDIDAPTVDLFSILGTPPAPELLMDGGLHFTLAGQRRLAFDVIRGWIKLS
jgi:lysophospholipase L1-like esterase